MFMTSVQIALIIHLILHKENLKVQFDDAVVCLHSCVFWKPLLNFKIWTKTFNYK